MASNDKGKDEAQDLKFVSNAIPKFPIRKEVAKDDIVEYASYTEDKDFDRHLTNMLMDLLKSNSWAPIFGDRLKTFDDLPIIGSLPLVCRADDCPYALVCPIMRNLADMPTEREKLKGSTCRAEKIYAVQLFTQLIKDLDVQPENTTDVLTLTNLVRHYVYLRRADWEIAVCGLMLEEPSVIAQRTAEAYYKRQLNTVMVLSKDLNKQLASLNSQLMASRRDRALLASQMGGKKDIVSVFTGTASFPVDQSPSSVYSEEVTEADFEEIKDPEIEEEDEYGDTDD